MKHNKALGVALVAAMSGILLVGCTSDNATTASSTTPAPATPSISATSGGSITVALTDLAGHEGEHVAGVLLKDYPGPDSTGVAGFVTPIDDPFTQQQVLGNVREQWPEPINPETGMGWPWPRGVAHVPPGDYTLMLWAAKDNFCCYSRWVPAQTPGLTGCQLGITATGEPQTITIKGLSSDVQSACSVM
jgi:hypothetical protein